MSAGEEERPSGEDLACDFLQERKAHDIRVYGAPLPPNGPCSLLDATQQAADVLVYLRGKLWEEDNPDRTWVGTFLWACITGAPEWGEFHKIKGIPVEIARMAQAMFDSQDEEEDPSVGS